jgi:hypothetical protein
MRDNNEINHMLKVLNLREGIMRSIVYSIVFNGVLPMATVVITRADQTENAIYQALKFIPLEQG